MNESTNTLHSTQRCCKYCGTPLPLFSHKRREFCKPYTDEFGRKVDCKNEYFNTMNSSLIKEGKALQEKKKANNEKLEIFYRSGPNPITFDRLFKAGFNFKLFEKRVSNTELGFTEVYYGAYGLQVYSHEEILIFQTEDDHE